MKISPRKLMLTTLLACTVISTSPSQAAQLNKEECFQLTEFAVMLTKWGRDLSTLVGNSAGANMELYRFLETEPFLTAKVIEAFEKRDKASYPPPWPKDFVKILKTGWKIIESKCPEFHKDKNSILNK